MKAVVAVEMGPPGLSLLRSRADQLQLLSQDPGREEGFAETSNPICLFGSPAPPRALVKAGEELVQLCSAEALTIILDDQAGAALLIWRVDIDMDPPSLLKAQVLQSESEEFAQEEKLV